MFVNVENSWEIIFMLTLETDNLEGGNGSLDQLLHGISLNDCSLNGTHFLLMVFTGASCVRQATTF